MRYGAISKINPVILEFVKKEDISKIKTKSINNVKKQKIRKF